MRCEQNVKVKRAEMQLIVVLYMGMCTVHFYVRLMGGVRGAANGSVLK